MKNEVLVGRWFHSFKDGHLIWQGQVISRIDETHYLVQLYDWLVGSKSIQKVVHIDWVSNWQFFDTDADMREIGHGYGAPSFEVRMGREDM